MEKLGKNRIVKLNVVPNETMIMYGINVMRNMITADTDPILADEKNDDIRKLLRDKESAQINIGRLENVVCCLPEGNNSRSKR